MTQPPGLRMDHDFYAYYSTLSNVELLQIRSAEEHYQPEAIAAAIAILQSRTVTDEDHRALEDIHNADKAGKQQKQEKREALIGLAQKIADTAGPGKKTLSQQLM